MTGLCVALDVATLDAADALCARLVGHVDVAKVGFEVLWRDGPAALDRIAAHGVDVFADTKLHDIPRTVETAARGLVAAHPCAMFTIHLGGGLDMARAALAGAAAGADDAGRPRPWVLGVTVLTSLDDAAVAATGHTASVGALVRRRAELAVDAGIDGIVCAVTDLAALADLPATLRRVTPGIRPGPGDAPAAAGAVATAVGSDDQARVATPAAAAAAGASLIVVGRPIVASPDPVAAADAIHAELASAR